MNAIVKHEATPDEVYRVLENSLYPGARKESIALVLSYCRMNGIDPLLRPVHIVPTSVKLPSGQYEMRDVLMPGIADYRIKAARSGEYAGKSEPEFGPDVERFGITFPAWCRVTVTRIVAGSPRQFTANERWLENYATAKRDTDQPNMMWRKRPYGQLAKCAEAQALRMAFPEFSGGQVTAEEMEGKTLDNSGPMIEAKAEPAPHPTAYAGVVAAARNGNGNGVSREDQEWLDDWQTQFNQAATTAEVKEIEDSGPYQRGIAKAPKKVADLLRAICTGAYIRAQPKVEPSVEMAPADAAAPAGDDPWA